ncbi:MAG: complex I subunit 5 family protein, partial [Pseudomonadales bacterium]
MTTAVPDLAFAPILLAVPLLPLLLATGLAIPALRRFCLSLAPWAAVPALAAALLLPTDAVLEVPALLLGARFGVDQTGQAFLLFTGLLWWLAGLFGSHYMADDPGRVRYTAFYLVAMGGSLGISICLDLASFFVLFAVMSFSSYGLVVHNGDEAAKRAARIYIALAVLGETFLFAAIALIVSNGEAVLPYRGPVSSDALIALLFLGFGIKAGALPLHFWLPLAHPAAPVPASAVLSGAMIKAGLLGWIRFLPLGAVNEPEWGLTFVIAGLAAAFYGALVGVLKDTPKTVLAYSSISQMGLMTIAIGIALTSPEAAPLALAAAVIYALHHGLAKGALFLGVGMATYAGSLRSAVLIGLLLPAVALMGLPLTSGAVAKAALKSAVGLTAWSVWLDPLLALAAVGTTLLMARFLFTLHSMTNGQHSAKPGLWSSWAALMLTVALLVWFWPPAQTSIEAALSMDKMWGSLWPPLLGVLLAAMIWNAFWRPGEPSAEGRVGSILQPFEAILRRAGGMVILLMTGAKSGLRGAGGQAGGFLQLFEDILWRAGASAAAVMTKAELRLRDWPVAGVVFLLSLLL